MNHGGFIMPTSKKIDQLLQDAYTFDICAGRPHEGVFPDETCDPGVRHDPEEVLKRNALFLLNSSRKIESYDKLMILKMEQFFDKEDYKRVIELCCEHDVSKRERGMEYRERNMSDTTLGWDFFSRLVSLLSPKKNSVKPPERPPGE